jgi:hypothetical protein
MDMPMSFEWTAHTTLLFQAWTTDSVIEMSLAMVSKGNGARKKK